MSDVKLFNIKDNKTKELKHTPVVLEKIIQNIVEKNCEELLGVRFIKSEHSFKADDGHLGRIDTLGIDENNCPVIIEYKKSSNNSIINQGLFYMDWLKRHKKDFDWLVLEVLGKKAADIIDWSAPRLICIANDFSRYDNFAINEMPANIDLIRYKTYENEFLLFELTTSSEEKTTKAITSNDIDTITSQRKTITDKLETASEEIKEIYKEIDNYILDIDENIQKKTLMHYIAYRRLKNFASINIYLQKILMFVNVDPDTVTLEKGFTRDVRNLGHYGTGKLEIIIKDMNDFEKAKPLIEKSFENS